MQRQVHVEVAGCGERAVRTKLDGGEGHEVGALSTHAGATASNSLDAPNLESRTRTSPANSAPMSPCSASTGPRNPARATPSDASVCAVLRATIPDLPTPVKKTAPGASMSACVNATADEDGHEVSGRAGARGGEPWREGRRERRPVSGMSVLAGHGEAAAAAAGVWGRNAP
jgi:hypothetical protein